MVVQRVGSIRLSKELITTPSKILVRLQVFNLPAMHYRHSLASRDGRGPGHDFVFLGVFVSVGVHVGASGLVEQGWSGVALTDDEAATWKSSSFIRLPDDLFDNDLAGVVVLCRDEQLVEVIVARIE